MGKTGTELQTMKNALKLDVKSMLLAAKNGMTESELKRDYEVEYGRELPYTELGYNSLYDLMREWREDVNVRRRFDGTWQYYGIHDASTANIGRLIEGQLDSKKSLREKQRANEGRVNNMHSTYGAAIRSQSSSASRYAPAAKTPNYSSNGFAFRYAKKAEPVTPPLTSSSAVPPKATPTNTATAAAVVKTNQPFLPKEIQDEIVEVLNRSADGWLSLNEFESDYTIVFGYPLDAIQWGFSSLLDLFDSLKHMIYVEYASSPEKASVKSTKFIKIGLIVRKDKPNNPTEKACEPKEQKAEASFATTEKKTEKKQPPVQAQPQYTDSTNELNNLEAKTLVNLKCLLERHRATGLFMDSICRLYTEEYPNEHVEFKKFGYESIGTFIMDKMEDCARIDDTMRGYVVHLMTEEELERYKLEFLRFQKENHDEVGDLEKSEAEEDELTKNELMVSLYEDIEVAMTRRQVWPSQHIPLNEFCSIYELCHKRRLDLAKYKLSCLDQLMCKLKSLGRLVINDEDGTVSYTTRELPPKSPGYMPSSTSARDTNNNNTGGGHASRNNFTNGYPNRSKNGGENVYEDIDPKKNKMKEDLLYQAECLRNRNDIYADESRNALNHRKLLLQIADPAVTDNRHTILVSHVTNPCDLQFQLTKNLSQLESLMDKLEKQYYGIGATNFTMPDEYIITGRLCAGVYPVDNNWHRCEIVQVFSEDRRVKIAYIDYGGFGNVDFPLIKFLRRDFGELPVQALKAKFANVRFKKNKNVKDETVINYMLNKVMNKKLEATITGVINDETFCLEIADKTTMDNVGRKADTPFSLNTRIIMDGYGESCDDSKQSGFVDFDTWRSTLLAREEADKRKLAEAGEAEAAAIAASRAKNGDDAKSGVRSSTATSAARPLPELTVAHRIHDGNVIEFTAVPRISYKKVKVDTTIACNDDNTGTHTMLLTLILIDQSYYAHTEEIAQLIGTSEYNLVNVYPQSYADCSQRFLCNETTRGHFANMLSQIHGASIDKNGEFELLMYYKMGMLIKNYVHATKYPLLKTLLVAAPKLKKYTGEEQKKKTVNEAKTASASQESSTPAITGPLTTKSAKDDSAAIKSELATAGKTIPAAATVIKTDAKEDATSYKTVLTQNKIMLEKELAFWDSEFQETGNTMCTIKTESLREQIQVIINKLKKL